MCANCIIDSDFFIPLDKLTVKLKCAFWAPTKNEQEKRERRKGNYSRK